MIVKVIITMKKITFNENPIIINSHILYDHIDFCSNIPVGKYILKIVHCNLGIGMSDRYFQESFIEIYLGEENVTKSLLRKWAYENESIFPISATTENLRDILNLLHSIG
jgi:hypothetical protein